MSAPQMSTPGADQHRTPASGALLSSAVASFPDYVGAQALVDRMSDGGFPVDHVRIVGNGLRTVEQVTGRFTKGWAALTGAGSGAWIGLLIGLLLGLFTIGTAWITIILTSVVIGAAWGALFGFLGHLGTRGMRDFRSVQILAAQRYDVEVDSAFSADATRFVRVKM